MTNERFIDIYFPNGKYSQTLIQALKQLADDLDLFPFDAVPQTFIDASARCVLDEIRENKVIAENRHKAFLNCSKRYKSNLRKKKMKSFDFDSLLSDAILL